MESKVSYVTQEVVVVIKDIFRRYPNQYEGIISTLCENLDDLTESESKSAIIWIVGQYADRIDNAVELLEDLSYNFLEDSVEVSLSSGTTYTGLSLISSYIGSTRHINCYRENVYQEARSWKRTRF